MIVGLANVCVLLGFPVLVVVLMCVLLLGVFTENARPDIWVDLYQLLLMLHACVTKVGQAPTATRTHVLVRDAVETVCVQPLVRLLGSANVYLATLVVIVMTHV